MGDGRVGFTVSGRGDASPEQVFATLTDLRTHVDWGGRRQLRTARIRTLNAPEGIATVGTCFSSVGGFPNWRLHERHVVHEATRPRLFAFETESDARATIRGAAWSATFAHRYVIEPDAGGCVVTYRFTQTSIVDPPLRFCGPFGRVSYGIVRLIARRGLRNLLAVARER